MHKKRRLRSSMYTVFALIFLLVLGMDLYRYVQAKDNDEAGDKSDIKNTALTLQGISENNENLVSDTVLENSEINVEEAGGRNSEEKQNQFFIAVYQNKIIVYLEDKKTVYEYTNIDTKELPLELRSKLSDGFFLNGEEELYHFLESYSS